MSQKVLDQLSHFVTDSSKPLVLYNGVDTSKFHEFKLIKKKILQLDVLLIFGKLKTKKL